MVYLRKLLKKVGIIPILELHQFENSYLIELILIKIWVELNIELNEKREKILIINNKYFLQTTNNIQIKVMSIHNFSNMEISNEILLKYENKEAELVLLLIYEFLIDLLSFKWKRDKLDFHHFHSDFVRFESPDLLKNQPTFIEYS